MRSVVLLIAALMALATPAVAAPRSLVLDHEELGRVPLFAPAGEPDRFAIFITDLDGITDERRAEAEALVARGAAVALIDLKALAAKFARPNDDDCIYTFGDFEDLARMAQRQLAARRWHWPILFGTGAGGTLAYLALAQAPTNTAGGAVSIGFAPRFASSKPLCPGAAKESFANGAYSYRAAETVPGPWALIAEKVPTADVQAFVDGAGDASVKVVEGDAGRRFAAAVDALFSIEAPVADGLSDLPLTELPAEGGAAHTMMILISGDGGWRDLDKQIGEYLSQHGVSVVGVDSLRYFWSRKEPGQIAADLDRIAAHYADKWKITRLALGGYSFGADVLPMAWPKLSHETRERTGLIALLGLEPTVDLEVSVAGFLGIASDRDIDVTRYLAGLPKERTLCFYGVDEKKQGDTACVAPALAGATIVERPGGHHFDGDYETIAKTILDRLGAPIADRPEAGTSPH